MEQPFEVRIWDHIKNLLNENKKELALVYLYESLIDEKNESNCDNFLKYSINMQMDSDIIIHILNALSPIKSKLPFWDEFKLYSISLLDKEVGVRITRILVNAICDKPMTSSYKK